MSTILNDYVRIVEYNKYANRRILIRNLFINLYYTHTDRRSHFPFIFSMNMKHIYIYIIYHRHRSLFGARVIFVKLIIYIKNKVTRAIIDIKTITNKVQHRGRELKTQND